MFGNYFKHVLILTLLAGLTYSLPQVKDAMAGAFDISYAGSSAYTAAAGDLMKVASGPVTVKEVRGKVGYDSKHQESSININAKVQITATGDTMYIPVDGFSFTLRNKTLNIDGGYARSSVVTSNLPMDTKGTYTLKSGTTALFTVTASANPKSMIAGQYTASLTAVVTDNNKIQPPANSSNTFVVVGESSPYITLVGQGLYGSKDTLVLNSVRLGRNPTITFKPAYDICEVGKVCPPSAPQTFSLRGSSNTKHVKFDLSNKNLKPAQYQVYVTNTELGETSGKSNIVMIQILDQSKILTAKVIAGKLALAYDSNNKESSLSAPFEITIKAGKEDIVLDDGAFSVYANTNGTSVMNAQVQIKSINSQTVSLPYILKAGKEARIMISASVNPKILQAGSYSMSLNGVYTKGVYIQVNQNETNSVVIVGEVSPYITSVNPNPAIAGQPFSISGQRLAGAQIFIDGTALTTSVAGAVDGTLLSTILPTTLQDGFHMLYVRNNLTGQSNNFWFESVGGPVQASTITIISPNGGETFKVGTSLDTALTIPVSWDSSGLTNQPEQALWVALKNQNGGVCNIGSISSYSHSMNIGVYAGYQCPGTGWSIAPGQYQAFVYLENSNTVKDSSDSYFTIEIASSTLSSVNVAINPSSPASATIPAGQTGVTLAVINLKASSNISTLNGIQLASDSNDAQNKLSNLKLFIGSTLIDSVPNLVDNGSYYFAWVSGKGIALPADTTVSLRLVADITASSTGSIRLGVAGLNFDAPGATTSGMPIYGSLMNIDGSICAPDYACTGSPSVYGTSASAGSPIMNGTSAVTYPVTFNFSINNPTNNALYVASDIGWNLASSTIIGTGKGTLANIATPQALPGDTSDRYIIPAATSRTFKIDGFINRTTSGLSLFKITSIMYGLDSTNITASISSALENLSVSVIF